MSETLSILPGEIPTAQLHGLLLGAVAPRPIAFASTIDKEGNPNLAPFSFFNVFSSSPPMLVFSPARRVKGNTIKHTLENVMEVPEVVINVVSFDILDQMNLASTEYERGINEFVKAGLTMEKSDFIRPFRVKESPVQMECKVKRIQPLSNQGGAGNLIFCEVVKMHIHADVLDETGAIDPHKIDLVARMGKDYYCRASGAAVFTVEKPHFPFGMGIDSLPAPIRESQWLTGNQLGKLGNIPSLPDQAEISAFQSAESALLKSLSSREALHRLAGSWIDSGEKQKALLLLMCD